MEEYSSLECDYRGNGSSLDPEFEVTLLEPRPFRPFKSSEEYLYAMKEDLAEWLNGLYEGLRLNAENFLEQMETGVVLCRHANNVVRKAREYYRAAGGTVEVQIPDRDVVYRTDVLPETFHARDNVSNFISWCRALHVKECLLFETDDLVLRKNERSFILCLLEVARRGAKFGMPAPLLVQLEQEIDAELANDDGYQTTFHHVPQVVTNDLRSLHERVVELLSRCTCPSQFPMIRVADGKYRIGDTKVLIFVRILRSHVMVRVGGGWDTLEHYLDKHDPCRCRSGHRLATSAKLTMHQGKSSIPSMHVTYNRPSQAPSSTPSSPQAPRRSAVNSTSLQHQADSTDSPQRYPGPIGGSDDSSASNEGHRYPAPQKKKKKKGVVPLPQSGGSSSVELSEEEDSATTRATWVTRSPIITKRNDKKEFLKDTVPSSWQYSPANDASPPSTLAHQKKNSGGPANRVGPPSTRLPSLASRNKALQPPQVVKVSPRLAPQSKWADKRSQSNEDLCLDSNSGPAHKNLVFHSRGTSPVNMKGRQSAESALGFGTPRDFPANFKNKENVSVDSFRRNDPIRHSSYHSSTYTKRSPPKPPLRHGPSLETRQVRKTSPISYNRRGFVSPERSQYGRKHSDKGSSPVLEKLLHSDLCSDESFVRKIEMLIAEYQIKPKKRDSLDDEFDKDSPRSLPLDLQCKMDSVAHQRRSPKDTDRRSPSKIPLPTWH